MIKKILTVISYILVVFIVCVGILLAMSGFAIGGVQSFIVKSGSMEPAIHTGSVVLTRPAANYKIGNIITFGPNTKTEIPTTHRIVEMRIQNGFPVFVTKGDANNVRDSKEIPQSTIIGKVYLSIPFFGYIIDAAKKPWGFAIIIIVPAVIVIYEELKKVWKEILNMRKKKEEKKEVTKSDAD